LKGFSFQNPVAGTPKPGYIRKWEKHRIIFYRQ
jgi:hypothetical protein